MPHPYHSMHIYDSEAKLARVVVRLVAQALEMEQPALLICSSAAQAAIFSAMHGVRMDLERLRRESRLEVLDSRDVIDVLVAGDVPDPVRFETRMTALLRHLCREHQAPCIPLIYADIGDVLIKDGNAAAAVSVEGLWNALAARVIFSLTCGYAAAYLHRHIPSFEELQAVCGQHTLVRARLH